MDTREKIANGVPLFKENLEQYIPPLLCPKSRQIAGFRLLASKVTNVRQKGVTIFIFPCRQNGPSFPLFFKKRPLKVKQCSWKPRNLYLFVCSFISIMGSQPWPTCQVWGLLDLWIKFYWNITTPICLIICHCSPLRWQQSLKYSPPGSSQKTFADSLFQFRELGMREFLRHHTPYTWIISSNFQWLS